MPLRRLLLAALLVSSFSDVIAEDISSTISACWKDRGHIQMTKCVKGLADNSDAELRRQEEMLEKRLMRLNDHLAERLTEARKALPSAKLTFRKYRTAQCHFAGEGSLTGNGDQDWNYARKYRLNTERIQQLKNIAENWE